MVVPSVPGDVNGDGTVDCLDLTTVRTAFGKKAGEPEFNERADVVQDGVIDIRDLAYVAQRLPAGRHVRNEDPMNRLICLATLFAASACAATIRIDPPSSSVAVGGTVSVNVGLLDIADLYGFQFDLAFNPAALTATGVTDGGFLSGGFFIPGSIDNALGAISFTANTLLGPGAGASGSGSLAIIRFTGRAAGTSPLTLSNPILLDSQSGDIAASIQNGSVTVGAVPEPISALLLGECVGNWVGVPATLIGTYTS